MLHKCGHTKEGTKKSIGVYLSCDYKPNKKDEHWSVQAKFEIRAKNWLFASDSYETNDTREFTPERCRWGYRSFLSWEEATGLNILVKS